MTREEIYNGPPLNVAEVERLCTALALDEDQKTTDRLRALDMLHGWALDRVDYGGEAPEREQLTIRLEAFDE